MPINCGIPSQCLCHHDEEKDTNTLNCSFAGLNLLPRSIPDPTETADLRWNDIRTLAHYPTSFGTVNWLDLEGNGIASVSGTFITQICQHGNIRTLKLSKNAIQFLPKEMPCLKMLRELWLQENLFVCNCEMMWMVQWLNNFILPSQKHIVVKYQELTCNNGKLKGLPMYALTDAVMGCAPWTTGQKLGMTFGVGATFMMILTGLIVAKRSREARFLMFYFWKLDTVPKDDKAEDLSDKEYDAFFCYWWVRNALPFKNIKQNNSSRDQIGTQLKTRHHISAVLCTPPRFAGHLGA